MSDSYPNINLKNPYLAAFLAWLVPGLGHLYQGRWGKGILLAVCINGLFWSGMVMGSWGVVWLRWDDQEKSYGYLAQIGVGLAALPALITDEEFRSRLPEPLKSFEVAPRKNNVRDEQVLNDIHVERGKLMEVAFIYTVIAGLLNYFAIYDALAGPAMRDEEEREIRLRRKTPPVPEGVSA